MSEFEILVHQTLENFPSVLCLKLAFQIRDYVNARYGNIPKGRIIQIRIY